MASLEHTRAVPRHTGSAARAHLQLMRPANMVTAMADVLAGFAVAGLTPVEKLPWLLASGLLLYGGGVTMNDFFDRRLDAVERPERPIPSGRASARGACLQGIVMLLLGIACAFQASAASATIAAALAALALSYDAGGKHVPVVGPVLMGSCRGLDLLLGLSAGAELLPARWYVAAIPMIYIAGITLLSAGEVHGGTRARSIVSAALMILAATVTLALANWSLYPLLSTILMVALLAWRVGPPVGRTIVFRGPSPASEAGAIRLAIRAGVINLVFLDAAIAAAYQGLLYAMGLVVLVLLVSGLARKFPVT